MKTVDKLLSDIVKNHWPKFNNQVPLRDKKILASLDKQIHFGNFLTKNQADLLVKIVKENEMFFREILKEDYLAIETPTWSKPFRIIQPVKKIYREKDNHHNFCVEFTWNKKLHQCMTDLSKDLQGGITKLSNKIFYVPLTEKNIYLTINKFKPLKFEISKEIENFYNEISQLIEKNQIPYEIKLENNLKLLSRLASELQEENLQNEMLLRDRQLRYQYQISCQKSGLSLAEMLSVRNQPRVWIKESLYTLKNVIESVTSLDRFPLLIVMNGNDSKESFENLVKFTDALRSAQVKEVPSVYFRFDSTNELNIKFNTFVNENQLNQKLGPTTKIAVLANNKLPKFLFKSGWYPRSVISFTNAFRTNKTSIWCDAVDLQIFYNERQPIIGGTDAIL